MLACVCMLLIFLWALIKVILHKTSRVLLVCFQSSVGSEGSFSSHYRKVLHQGCFVSSLVEIGPVVLEKKTKMCKVYDDIDDDDNDDDDDDDRQRTNSDKKSSLETSAQVS